MRIIGIKKNSKGENTNLFASLWLLGLATFFFSSIGQDAPLRLEWHRQFNRLFWDGTLYPHWLPESFSGFGSPTFYFYPPLVFWIGAILNPNNILSPEYSNQIASFLAIILSGWTMYLYLKRYGKEKKITLVCAAFYAVHPYRILDSVVRSATSEHFAFVFIPLVLIALDSLLSIEKDYTWRSYFYFTVGFTGLILTNIPSTVIMSVAALLYLAVQSKKLSLQRLTPLFLSAITVLCITSFYTFPILELRDSVMLDRFANYGKLYGSTNYILIDLFSKHFKFMLTLALVLTFALYGFIQAMRDQSFRTASAQNRSWIALAVLALLMQIPYLQSALSAVLPLSSTIQFSWRWLLLLVPFASIVIIQRWKAKGNANVLIAGLVLSILLIGVRLYYYHHLRTSTEAWKEGPEYLSKYSDTDPWKAAAAFERHSQEPMFVPDRVIELPAEKISLTQNKSYSWIMQSNLLRPLKVTFHEQYFPLWKLFSETSLPNLGTDSLARLTAILPAGNNSYTLTIGKSHTSGVSSALTILGILAFVITSSIAVTKKYPTSAE